MIFLSTMEKRGWLKKGPVENLFQGGWRYRNCLFEYGIWSNFPETEEDYALEVSQKILADIPRGVVAQLEQGDRVNLAGKRLQIMEIVHAKGAGRVVALPSTDQESKEIFWLGPGMQVSWEVAQSVRRHPRDRRIPCLKKRNRVFFRVLAPCFSGNGKRSTMRHF